MIFSNERRNPENVGTELASLIHQLPAKPAYLAGQGLAAASGPWRGRRHNAVHALPMGEGAQEDFEWLLREIVEGGGEAFLCET
jgi:hypothetical protein